MFNELAQAHKLRREELCFEPGYTSKLHFSSLQQPGQHTTAMVVES